MNGDARSHVVRVFDSAASGGNGPMNAQIEWESSAANKTRTTRQKYNLRILYNYIMYGEFVPFTKMQDLVGNIASDLPQPITLSNNDPTEWTLLKNFVQYRCKWDDTELIGQWIKNRMDNNNLEKPEIAKVFPEWSFMPTDTSITSPEYIPDFEDTQTSNHKINIGYNGYKRARKSYLTTQERNVESDEDDTDCD